MFDSGFFVEKVIDELEARGVYGVVLIKKRQYWLRNVPDDNIDKQFEGKKMGAVDFLNKNTNEGEAFKIHYIKEPDYVIKLMAPWMTLNNLEGANTKRDWKENVVIKLKQFVYKQHFGAYFRYRH